MFEEFYSQDIATDEPPTEASQHTIRREAEGLGATLRPAHDQALRIQIAESKCTQRGMTYAVYCDGALLIAETYDPEFDACRVLLNRGVTGKLVTYRSRKACMILDIEKAAGYRTTTNNEGTPTIKKLRGAKST